ncbi:MAG: DUF4625 domain-containing protein [Bacteroidales bacterium]
MKTSVLFLTSILLTTIFFSTSCNKEDLKPTIQITELGIDNSKKAFIGEDFHIEAEIMAEKTIDVVTLEIHNEKSSNNTLEIRYNEFAGKKNIEFHKHIKIPTSFSEGVYHVHLSVIDKKGNETIAKDEITITKKP